MENKLGGGGEAEARGRETGLETVAIAYGKSRGEEKGLPMKQEFQRRCQKDLGADQKGWVSSVAWANLRTVGPSLTIHFIKLTAFSELLHVAILLPHCKFRIIPTASTELLGAAKQSAA